MTGVTLGIPHVPGWRQAGGRHGWCSVDAALDQVTQAISAVLLGKQEQVRLALCCLLAGGHLLIEDRPGLGKSPSRKPWPAVGTWPLSASVSPAIFCRLI